MPPSLPKTRKTKLIPSRIEKGFKRSGKVLRCALAVIDGNRKGESERGAERRASWRKRRWETLSRRFPGVERPSETWGAESRARGGETGRGPSVEVQADWFKSVVPSVSLRLFFFS